MLKTFIRRTNRDLTKIQTLNAWIPVSDHFLLLRFSDYYLSSEQNFHFLIFDKVDRYRKYRSFIIEN